MPDEPVGPPHVEPALSPRNIDRPANVVTRDLTCDGCGYNLRSLPLDGRCPECGRAVTESLSHARADGVVSRVDRRWALQVLVGVAALVAIYPSLMWIDLNMSFPDVAFGTAPKLNVPGPKVWAVPLVQRSLGSAPEYLGAQGTWLCLISLLAIGLITTKRRDEASGHLATFRLITRWQPAILLGGFFGFLLNAEDTYRSDVAVSKYAMFAVTGVELPCTAMLFAYLAYIAGAFGQLGLRRHFHVALLGTVIAQIAGIAMTVVARRFADQRKDFVVQLWSACYESLCCVVALMIVSAMVRLMWVLTMQVAPRRIRAWLS